MILNYLYYVLIFQQTNQSLRPLPINLSIENPVHNDLEQTNFKKNHHDNQFQINLEDDDMMKDNLFFLILESDNPNFSISILGNDSDISSNSNQKLDLITTNGNIMFVLSESMLNGHFNFFLKDKKLKFKIKKDDNDDDDLYTIKTFIQKQAYLKANKVYTTRVDLGVEEFLVLAEHGDELPDIHKIRFQCHAIDKEEDYNLQVDLRDPSGGNYVLNQIFKDTVGGMLDKEKFNLCQGKSCAYTLTIKSKGIKLMNIETTTSSEIEELDYTHLGPLYERKYKVNQKTNYILKFSESVREMDVSISLIPVTGSTGLFINAKTLPIQKENYVWSQQGALAKRITIKWEELVQMKSEGSDLYITVFTEKQGEFFLQVDAHQQGIKGRLKNGIIEAGFVVAEEIQNYLHRFQIFKTQKIDFQIDLSTQTGDVDLYMKQCDSLFSCNFKTEDLKDGFSVQNSQSKKSLSHSFTCKHDDSYVNTICNFCIAVVGKENNGSHYELALHQKQQHRLMTPGHQLSLSLTSEEKQYFKFSFPHSSYGKEKLFLEIEAIWGNFQVFVGKSEFPSEENNSFSEQFYSTKTGLLQSLKSINLNQKMSDLQGQLYVTISSLTSSQLNLRFLEKNDSGIGIQTLKAGEQLRGSITNKETIYYSIKASLNKIQSKSIQIILTPIKGTYLMFTSRGGQIPTLEDNNLMTKNSILELTYDDYYNKEEHIIGVQLQKQDYETQEYQFFITFNYSNKPLLLKPGVLTSYRANSKNMFLIEIVSEMGDLLILKSIKDGHNISICARFSGVEDDVDISKCDHKTKGKDVSLYLNDDQLKAGCKDKNKCYFILQITANVDQEFSLGYTYNDHPFKITKGTVINGPNILKGNHKLNFILHIEQGNQQQIYFNSKGLPLNIYTKLISYEEHKDIMVLPFPTESSNDKDNVQTIGSISNIYYSDEDIQKKGKRVELLISIRPHPSADSKDNQIFDGRIPFILQSVSDTMEILRTEVTHYLSQEEEYNYFHFYNNGTSDEIRVYVVSEEDCFLEVLLTRDIHSKPPFEDSYLVKQNKIGSVELLLTSQNMQEKGIKTDSNVLKGHYTLVVKTSSQTYINLYWSNKPNINYIEVTPGQPYKQKLTKSKFYFTFFAKDVDHPTQTEDRDDIVIYIKSEVRADVFIVKTDPTNLTIPNDYNQKWKGSVGREGGITSIKIDKNHPDYCISCSYIGYVDSQEDGNINLFVDIEHTNLPIFLLSGFTFPMQINKQKIFRIFNPDTDQIFFNLAILSGSLEYFVSKDLTFEESGTEIGQQIKYKQISIKPSQFNISSSNNYYVKIVNKQKKYPSTFNISVVKNSQRQQIEIGVKKVVEVNEFESADFTFKSKQGNYFVQIEVIGIEIKSLKDIAVQSLEQNVKIFTSDYSGKKYPIKSEQISSQNNKVYIEMQAGDQEQIILQLFNKVKSMVQYTILVSNNNYSLINLDEYNYRTLESDQFSVFEIHGNKGENLFVDLRMCYGELQIQFYEQHYSKISSTEFTDFKTIKDNNSLVHYINMKSDKVFVKVKIPEERQGTYDRSVFDLKVFTERHLDENPYSEIYHGSEGKVRIDTESQSLTFDQIIIKSKYDDQYTHVVTYKLYLSDSLKVLKYNKNCGNFLRNIIYKDSQTFEFTHEQIYNSFQKINNSKDKTVTIKYKGLEPGKKYYGIVIVDIELFGKVEFSVKPIRTARSYYDEFAIVTSRFRVEFNLLLGIVLTFAVLCWVFFIIKDFVFGNLSKYKELNKLSDLENEEVEILGFDSVSLLEQEYYDTKEKKIPEANVEIAEHKSQDETNDENSIEMTTN